MATENKIVVDTGARTYTIYDSDEDMLGKFKFNPSDFGIIKRVEKAQSKLETLGEVENTDDLFAADETIKSVFDEMMNYPVSDSLFTKATPTTLLENGKFYFETVFEAITQLISNTVEDRAKKSRKRIAEATAQYKK